MASPNLVGSRGSAVEAALGAAGLPALVDKGGRTLPPTASYLRAQEEAERHAVRRRAWDHYIGNVKGHHRPEPGQPDINVISNRASTIVDTGVDFLYGKTVTFEVQQNGKPHQDAQDCLDSCWGNDAKRMTTLSKLGQNGGIFGHVFAKIIEPNPQRGRLYCRVVPLDPAQITAVTDPDDCDTVRCYVVEYQQLDTRFKDTAVARVQIIERVDPDRDDDDDDRYGVDPDATWEICDYLRGPNNQWYQLRAPVVWPHPWAPVVDWQNMPLANMHWGTSDIPPNVQHLNSVLNLTLTDVNAIGKFHGFPWLYASGTNPDTQLDIGPGKMTKFPAPEAKITAIEAHGDLAGLLGFADNLRGDMDEQTRVPAVATGRLRDVPRVTSGVAFQMMYGPLLGKTTHKQRLYETGHEELSLRMLSLCGYGDGTGQDGWCVVTHWPSPLPNDDASTAQLALAAQQVGMSQHYICEVLSEDYDTEMEYRRQEAQDAMKAALKGQAMMPRMPMSGSMPAMPAAPGQPGQPANPVEGQPGQSGAAPGSPPVNHPAAVAARQAARAAGAAMKVGA
jgi:hypothetical protein